MKDTICLECKKPFPYPAESCDDHTSRANKKKAVDIALRPKSGIPVSWVVTFSRSSSETFPKETNAKIHVDSCKCTTVIGIV
jgi:hypothetical protein